MKETDKDITYVAQHYRKGRFSTERGWQNLGIEHKRRRFGFRAAAAIVAVVVLSATAAIVYNQYAKQSSEVTDTTATETVSPELVVKVIDFEDTPLPAVISRISEVYGVEVVNLPEDAADHRLSLHYEGNALDLVDTINEILGTNLKVKSK
jgi:hypothetical protein